MFSVSIFLSCVILSRIIVKIRTSLGLKSKARAKRQRGLKLCFIECTRREFVSSPTLIQWKFEHIQTLGERVRVLAKLAICKPVSTFIDLNEDLSPSKLSESVWEFSAKRMQKFELSSILINIRTESNSWRVYKRRQELTKPLFQVKRGRKLKLEDPFSFFF